MHEVVIKRQCYSENCDHVIYNPQEKVNSNLSEQWLPIDIISVEITVNQLLSVTDKDNCSQVEAQGKGLLYLHDLLVLLDVRETSVTCSLT